MEKNLCTRPGTNLDPTTSQLLTKPLSYSTDFVC